MPSATAKTVRPLVLTMSGSSTPASWTLVCEKSGAADSPRAGEGAPCAVDGGADGEATGASAATSPGTGPSSSCGAITPARVGTPVRPPVMRALRRA